MDYFVSIENSNYFYWQVELLIESFKQHNLEDHLIIGVAENDEPKLQQFTKNISSHKKKFLHDNIGETQNYAPLNRIYAIANALKSGVLTQPFALIHADMVLEKQLDEPTEEGEWISFSNDAIPQQVINIIEEDAKILLQSKGVTVEKLPRVPYGSVGIFNNISPYFFQRVYQRTLKLMTEKGTDWDVEKGGWLLTLYEYLGMYKYHGTVYTDAMVSPELNNNFLHYTHGTSPYFNKRHFQYKMPMLFSLQSGSPYDKILMQAPVVGTSYLQNIVNSYLDVKEEEKEEEKEEKEEKKETFVESIKDTIPKKLEELPEGNYYEDNLSTNSEDRDSNEEE